MTKRGSVLVSTASQTLPAIIFALLSVVPSAASDPNGNSGGAAASPPGGGKEPSRGQPSANTSGPPAAKQPAESKPAESKPAVAKPLPQLSPEARYDYQGEATVIGQHLFSFPSPYDGPSSFRSRNETELSHSYTLFLGARLVRNVEVYLNPEMALGNGVGGVSGLGGYPNGDLTGQPSQPFRPYLARYFVRWRIPMKQFDDKGIRDEQFGRAPNLINGTVFAHRLVVTLGRFPITDVFDVNAYADNPRTQFINNAFLNNLAYDYAEDARGYNFGASVAWVNPSWALRAGTFAMPTTAAGPGLAYNLSDSHSEQIEGEIHPALLRAPKPPMVLRLLAYRNVGKMGSYADALNAQIVGMPPDITAVRRSGASRTGVGLNFDQGLADGGNTGVFGRAGWSNGGQESFGFAECDRFVSLGAQLSGAHWRRGDDRVGVAVAGSGLSDPHQEYLRAGGTGLALGDGKLRYGSERILETYYSYQLSKLFALSLDFQRIQSPGYNRDRGPASLIGLRFHALL